MNKTKVAVVGAGYFSQFHYDAWSRLDDVELVAAADLSQERVNEVASKHGIPSTFGSLGEMLDQTDVDLLDIVTPPTTHLDAIKLAAQHGVDAICQKPFCGTLADAKVATQIAADAGTRLIVHENFRFQPWYRKIGQMIASGAVGEPYQVTFRLRPGDGQGPEAYLNRQPYFQKMERFLVHETAIHQIDTFRYLMGEVSSVYADLRRINPVIAGEDAGIIVMEFANGARGLFDGNRLSDHIADNHRLTMGEMLVEGADGVITLDGYGGIALRARGANAPADVAYDWRDLGYGGDCVYLLQGAVVKGLRGEGPIENTAADYLKNLAIEESVYLSSSEGRKIVL